MKNAMEILESMQETLVSLESYEELYNQSVQGISKSDMLISDIMHHIELEEVEETEALSLIAELKDARLNRRAAKDDEVLYSHLKDFCEKNSTFISRFRKTITEMQEYVDYMPKRKYTPRIRKTEGTCQTATSEEVNLLTDQEEVIEEIIEASYVN